MRAIMLEFSHSDIRLWRNNCGGLYARDGRFVTFGLTVGSSDLIGIAGGRGRFIALECKLPGKHPTAAQRGFIAAVKALGGIAGVAHSVEEAREILNGH